MTTPAGAFRVDALAAKLPPRAWQRLSAEAGAKGQRWYDWAWVTIEPGRPGFRHLLARRSRSSGELAYYRCCSPRAVPLATLVKIAGIRWSTEENFQAGKGLAGLDEHQVRTWTSWTSWHRWVTLAMLALAFLTVAAAAEHAHPPPPGLIPLTRNEIAHLTAALLPPARPRPPGPLVQLAAPAPVHRPGLPLPAASRSRPMKVTIYCWSTSGRGYGVRLYSRNPLHDCVCLCPVKPCTREDRSAA